MSYSDGFVSLPERTPKPRAHQAHKLHPISWCGLCGEPVLFACSFRTRSRHELRAVRYFCSYTETRKHMCRKTWTD